MMPVGHQGVDIVRNVQESQLQLKIHLLTAVPNEAIPITTDLFPDGSANCKTTMTTSSNSIGNISLTRRFHLVSPEVSFEGKPVMITSWRTSPILRCAVDDISSVP